MKRFIRRTDMIGRSMLLAVFVFLGSLALGAASLVVVPAAHAQFNFSGKGTLFCGLNQLVVAPPSVQGNYGLSDIMVWYAELQHYDLNGRYLHSTWTDTIYFVPVWNIWIDFLTYFHSNYTVVETSYVENHPSNTIIWVREYIFHFASNRFLREYSDGRQCNLGQYSATWNN
jgi:hypothetical protein